jgi:transglutaminase/protease-like cytokinesis protein 3
VFEISFIKTVVYANFLWEFRVYSNDRNLGSCVVTVVPRGKVQSQVARVLFTESNVAINPADLGVSAAQLRQEVAEVIAGIEGIPQGFGMASNATGPVGISLILPGIVMHESMLDTQRRKVLVQERAAEIVNRQVVSGMSELERELVLYDHLVDNTRYDLQNYWTNAIPSGSASVYGVLINGIGVCDGYAKAFEYLMHQVGIECMYVLGDEMYHAWNIVGIDGRYYHVDVTWAVPGKRYAFFNLTDEQMARTHSWDRDDYPVCVGSK